MKLPKDTLTQYAAKGRMTLELPVPRWFNPTTGQPFKSRSWRRQVSADDAALQNLEEWPDDWFCRLRWGKAPCIGNRHGNLHLTLKGWEANRLVIIDTYIKFVRAHKPINIYRHIEPVDLDPLYGGDKYFNEAMCSLSDDDIRYKWQKVAEHHFSTVEAKLKSAIVRADRAAALLRTFKV